MRPDMTFSTAAGARNRPAARDAETHALASPYVVYRILIMVNVWLISALIAAGRDDGGILFYLDQRTEGGRRPPADRTGGISRSSGRSDRLRPKRPQAPLPARHRGP